MKRVLFLISALLVALSSVAQKKIPHAVKTYNEATARRMEIVLPKVKGYNCYKGDFHIHTSYSDGRVNPSGRVVEAWVDGLDVIAITDHYEGRTGEKKFLKVV
ncbi:MAG: histidinol-phosphatase, partial [Alistipes sp.]|nr:histidinol-phosphatase [Alistipes sp.]